MAALEAGVAEGRPGRRRRLELEAKSFLHRACSLPSARVPRHSAEPSLLPSNKYNLFGSTSQNARATRPSQAGVASWR